MNPLIQFRRTILPLLIALTFACFGPSPITLALLPPPDGGYPFATTAEGAGALGSLTLSGKGSPTAVNNTALGFDTLFNNTGGNSNTAAGARALFDNITGSANTATGYQALFHNTANGNTADGFEALYSNATATGNSATGYQALFHNDANANTADGFQALYNNTFGHFNTAIGSQALYHDIGEADDPDIGGNNTAVGYQALYNNKMGFGNTAVGGQALYNNIGSGQGGVFGDGNYNTAIGDGALFNNAIGQNNIAVGVGAGYYLTAGSSNIYIGSDVDISASTAEANTIRIGIPFRQGGPNFSHHRTFIAGIRGATTENADAVPVVIDSLGQLGTASSSRRFKHDIKPMDNASESILGLKPVTFRYKSDKAKTPQFGLLAEEVAEVNPDLVVRDDKGEVYTVRYEAVNAMLLNEFLKEHLKVEEQDHKIQEQEATIAQLKSDFQATATQLTARLKEQAAQIQKVSAQFQLSKPSVQAITDNP